MANGIERHPEMTAVSGDGTSLYGITGFYDSFLDDQPARTVFHGTLVVNREGELRGRVTDFLGEASLMGNLDIKRGLAQFVKTYTHWRQGTKPPDWHYELEAKFGDDYEGSYRERGTVGGKKLAVCTIFLLRKPVGDVVVVLW